MPDSPLWYPICNTNPSPSMVAKRQKRYGWLWLWPGLTGAWHEGKPICLLLAIGWALTLQLVLILTVVWPEMLRSAPRAVVCFGVAFFWVCSVLRSLALESRRLGAATPHRADDLFQTAQLEYLKGDWSQAESGLVQLLAAHPDDVEARLLLATLLRRTERPTEALAQLARLAQASASAQWMDEIRRERTLASDARQASDECPKTDLEAA